MPSEAAHAHTQEPAPAGRWRTAMLPLRNAPKLAPLITAIGMSFILQNVGLLWRPQPDSSPDLIGSQKDYFTIFGVTIEHSDVFAVVVTVPMRMCSSGSPG